MYEFKNLNMFRLDPAVIFSPQSQLYPLGELM